MSVDENGWTKYEYAVLQKLDDLDNFVQEVRVFMLDVKTDLAKIGSHPKRIADLEKLGITQKNRLDMAIWKIGTLGIIAGASAGYVMDFLITKVF